MSSFFYDLLIGPLETLFEMIFIVAYKVTASPGPSILVLSLIMNLLLLPLYNRTDAIQLETIETEKRLKPMVDHIKKSFHGNEQFMILQTYYRQNHYKPSDSLKGIAPLMLEIPFFMAAYHYLSHLHLLQGCSFGPIADLSAPDGMLVLGGVTLNLLPIAMTVINILSSMVYTKDAPLKTRIQLYGMAALFLVLLYTSPSGLVLYWTLNNLFSLIKNLLMKLKNPLLPVSVASCILGAAYFIRSIIVHSVFTPARILLTVLPAVLLSMPLLWYLVRKRIRPLSGALPGKKDFLLFLSANLILTLLLGFLIPSALIHTSPEEFLIPGLDRNPHSYVLHNALILAGLLLLWMSVFYYLSAPGGKRLFILCAWVICISALVDYLFFGKNYGLLSSQLVFDSVPAASRREILLNLAVLLAAAAAAVFLVLKKPDLIRTVSLAVAVAIAGMSGFNLLSDRDLLKQKLQEMAGADFHQDSIFSLDRQGKNVVVLMLDRAVGSMVPYIFEELPQLQQQFAGFTYYPNTISFGAHTNFGLPGVMGGYEYIPYNTNKRDQVLLKDKHDEALQVMPKLFLEAGFDTTVCDPTYAGYGWIPDLQIFSDDPEIHTYITMGRCGTPDMEDLAQTMDRKFLYYSLFKAVPVVLQPWVYDDGLYQRLPDPELAETENAPQVRTSLREASGINTGFRDHVAVLDALPDLTEITDTGKNTFLVMCNDTTHSPTMLQLPDYSFSPQVDNTPYEPEIPFRTDGEGNTIYLNSQVAVTHYHCNAAAYLRLGRWLDLLREEGVYDNTRIILVSDHGYNMNVMPELLLTEDPMDDVLFYNPLLMVKDFGATEFRVDDAFMTNADVPTLALDRLVDRPVNPFTGNPINSLQKEADPLYVCASHIYSTDENNGTTFLPDPWFAVSGPALDPASWTKIQPEELP